MAKTYKTKIMVADEPTPQPQDETDLVELQKALDEMERILRELRE